MALKVVVLGGGPGGYMAAVRASQLGAQVTLVEKDRLGGTCLHWGCIPTKTIKATCDTIDGLRRGKEMGIALEGTPQVDIRLLRERTRKVVETQEKGIAQLLKRHRVNQIQGYGKPLGPCLLEVEARDGTRLSLEWDRLITAIGSEPCPLPSLPFDGTRILSSSQFLRLEQVPKRVLVVGGGVVGCETACLLRSMGAEVYLVEAMDRLLPMPAFDPDMARVLDRELRKRGIKIFLRSTIIDLLAKDDELEVTLGTCASPARDVGHGETQTVLPVEQVIVAVGRAPATKGLGLEALGVKMDPKGWIQANEFLETRAQGVYAVGDVMGPKRPMLAHVAYREGIVAAENALGQRRKLLYEAVPCAVFTSPEVGFVGLSETQAKEKGIPALSETFLLRLLGKAQAIGEIGGQVKVVFEEGTHRVIGFQLIGANSTELLWGCTLAVAHGVNLGDLAELLFAHPTISEAIGEVANKALGGPSHEL